MSAIAVSRERLRVSPPVPCRSLDNLLAPLDRLATHSTSLMAKPAGRFEVNGQTFEMPRYLFIGPKGGDDPIRIGLFAGLHGDEPEGARALVRFLTFLEAAPELARGYCLFVYPVCNPTGYEDSTRCNRRGRDLNREFWNNSHEPEVTILERELVYHAFDGIVSLHTDDTSHGLYGFVSGATLTRDLLEPALAAAGEILPRNESEIIDGFAARRGVIHQGYQGILTAPPRIQPRPFEIVFETPAAAPDYLKEHALVLALQTILTEYRKFIAYAANL